VGESWGLANVLGAQGVPNYMDNWGPDWHHDWVTWREMVPRFLDEWTR
jgi:esterase/lipase superfamily enzyme